MSEARGTLGSELRSEQMADSPALSSPGRRRGAPITRSSLGRRAGAAPRILLVTAAAVAAVLVGPRIHASGQFAGAGTMALGTAAPAHRDQTSRAIRRSRVGYLVRAHGTGRVTVPLSLPVGSNARTLLRLWVYASPAVRTTVDLTGAGGFQRRLRPATSWTDHTIDVTALAHGGGAALTVTAANRLGAPVLFLDGVATELAPRSTAVTASTWSVALLVLLVAAAPLAVFGRLVRHWPLPLALAAFAALVWHRIPATSIDQLPATSLQTWDHVLSASWLGFHDGLLWGSWNGVSSLAVQIYHAFTPIVGTATVSARSAALLAALLAVAAIYAVAYRAAGGIGALVAVLVTLAASPLRNAAFDASAAPVLVLAAALALYGLHACLGKATPLAVGLFSAGLALVVLAEPLWLPGAVVAVLVVVAAFGERGARWRALGAGALVAAILLGPHLASTAAQNNGSLFADVNSRAVAARNAEYIGGGHGAPTTAELTIDPTASGHPTSLGGYVFGDHSLAQVAGSTLSGGQKALSAFDGDPSALTVIAFTFALIGIAYVLILPRLRALVLIPLIVALPTLFVAGRITTDDFAAGAVWWPVLPLSGAILAYAALQMARQSLSSRRAKARSRPRTRQPAHEA